MTILISGCSTGIGLDTAIFLKNKGFDVIATARSDEAILQLQDAGLKAIHLDVNYSNSIESAVAQAATMTDEGIDVLINNAGFGQAGALEDLSRSALREQFETNVFGLFELTNTILPYMIEQKKGRIINISSILGIVSLPFRGAYNASKYAVEALSDTLRLELSNTPIKVSLIEPGPIESKFRQTCVDKALEAVDIDNSRFTKSYRKMIKAQENAKPIPFSKHGDAVATKILKAINAKNPKPRYKVTLPSHLLSVLKRTLSSSQLDKILKIVSYGELS